MVWVDILLCFVLCLEVLDEGCYICFEVFLVVFGLVEGICLVVDLVVDLGVE